MAKFKGTATVFVAGSEIKVDVDVEIDGTHVKDNEIETNYEAFLLAKDAYIGWNSYEITE